MESKMFDYLANKVLQDLRSGHSLNDDLAKELNLPPAIDSLRPKIKKEDRDMLIALGKSRKRGARGLALALLKTLGKDKKVKDFFREFWKKTRDYNTKHDVMWRLLDYGQLEVELHREIFEFVIRDFDRWVTKAGAWPKGDSNVIPFVKDRLANPHYPKTKAWVYLCLSFASNNKREVGQLLDKYISSGEPIVRELASRLKKEKLNTLRK